MVHIIIRPFQKYPSLSLIFPQYQQLIGGISLRYAITSDASRTCEYSYLSSDHLYLANFPYSYQSFIGIFIFVFRKDTEFNENVDLLLSYLKSVPGLVEVDLRTEHLTEIWTSRILSFFHLNPKISHITYEKILFAYLH